KSLYQCSMHPSIISDKPGKCPICHMDLQKVDQEEAQANVADSKSQKTAGERRILYYRNPMNPSVTSQTPMKDNMGMDYIPVYEDEVSDAGPKIEGRASFSLSNERQQLIGVKTAQATLQNLS